MVDSAEAVPSEPTPAIVVAKAGRYYRVARYLMTVLLMAYGAWSIYDGFVSWPRWTETHPLEKPKTDTDIMLNKVLGVLLPPMGLIIVAWAIYNSRGEYRLENGVLHVPGHPPVPLEKIHSINREAWDRKGIAYVDYDLFDSPAPGVSGVIPNPRGARSRSMILFTSAGRSIRYSRRSRVRCSKATLPSRKPSRRRRQKSRRGRNCKREPESGIRRTASLRLIPDPS